MIIYTPIKLDNDEITRFIAESGIKWSLNIIDGPNAGRNILGTMILDYVASKVRLDISCRTLNQTDVRTLLAILSRRVFSVSYNDPQYGNVMKRMYTNNYSGTLDMLYDNNGEEWEGFTFPLIEL